MRGLYPGMNSKNPWAEHHELERRRRIPLDFLRTSLAGLALDSATSSGLGRAPALQCRTPSRHHLELQDRRDYIPADRAARTCWEKEKITRVPRERETRTHLKKVSPLRGCLQSEDITRMDCPAYSPDLNRIEHVWDMLRRRIAARQPPPTCLPELRMTLLDEWCNIPQDQIDNLILSMPRRCKACIASSGRHTQY
ncbi:transposable element Tcb1 transposase [Trichonephila clavipes]|nr:transposable element Tcb1 transposase [Trichonephila clavipes]